jgi:signal transduction histidine kinase
MFQPTTAGHRAYVLAAGTAVLGILLTVVWAATPLSFAVVRPGFRVLLETTQALVALLVAFLIYGRARRSGLVADLTLVTGFLLLGATNLFHAVVHSTTPAEITVFSRYEAWFPLVLRTSGVVLLVVAALAGDRRHRLARPGRVAVLAAGGWVGAATLVVVALAPTLPEALVLVDGPPDVELVAHPALQMAQLTLVVLWVAVAAGFARRHAADGRPLHLALAVGAVLAAVSRMNFALIPSLYSDIVQLGDGLRLAFYVVLGIGAGQEISRYWRAEVAGLERQRLARDLHDGLSQELAFLRSQLSSLASRPGAPATLGHLVEAAERASVESRNLVRVLDPVETTAPEVTLTRAAREVAERAGASVEIDIRDGVDLSGLAVADLCRIVREATSNAVRHGAATHVQVRLAPEGAGTLLEVVDDGSGFVRDAASAGYGLHSMRDRAATLGGDLRIISSPGDGTAVEVRLPHPPGRPDGGRQPPADSDATHAR